ncbi:hypothetical protein TNCV_2719461 [Trichonephila clavipes]|nr:hypothetical protein TNCV_2719461 [Trichonephila clavipes]
MFRRAVITGIAFAYSTAQNAFYGLVDAMFTILCTQDVLVCHHDLKNLSSLGKTPVPAIVPARCGISGSIKARAQEDLYNRVSHKSWWKGTLNLGIGPQRRPVAEFRLATGH